MYWTANRMTFMQLALARLDSLVGFVERTVENAVYLHEAAGDQPGEWKIATDVLNYLVIIRQ